MMNGMVVVVLMTMMMTSGLYYRPPTLTSLLPFSYTNVLAAADSYLLIGSNHLGTAKSEFQHIQSWASSNNLCLNASKTKELIVYKRGGGKCRAPLEVIQGAARVTQMKVLGVTLSADLGMTLHLDETLVRCAASMVALRTLRSHGLPPGQLEEVTRATTMATLLYAAPAWWGFASEGDRGRVERFIGRLRRSGYLLKEAPTAAEMVNEVEACLFRSVRCDSRHVLKKHLPPPKVHKYNLRMRPHNLTFRQKTIEILLLGSCIGISTSL